MVFQLRKYKVKFEQFFLAKSQEVCRKRQKCDVATYEIKLGLFVNSFKIGKLLQNPNQTDDDDATEDGPW